MPLLLAGLFALRAVLVESTVGWYTGCRSCYLVPTLGQDAWLVAAGLGLLALSWLMPWRAGGALARVIVGLLILVAAVDLVLLDLLMQRLHLDDVVRLGGALGNNWSVVSASLDGSRGLFKLLAAALVVVVAGAGLAGSRRRPRWAAGCLVLAAGALAFAVHARSLPLRYVHAVYVENVVTINLPQGRMKAYSDAHVAAAHASVSTLPETCEQNAAARRLDVIVLLVESLSTWHSRLFGGELDWTPRIDAIARDNHYLTRFYASGFTTSSGEIALITGRVPFNPPGAIELDFGNYALPEAALPTLARAAGYRSDFFTPGDSGFLDLGDWLRDLGFDGVHDSSDAFYSGHRRWQFGAAEDSVFHARYLDWLDRQPAGQRFISMMLTVTTHPPFVDPATGRIDPEASFRYVDAEVGAFHDALRARGFFEHGVLIVLGDHRSMTPLRAAEFARDGERAFARVPLVVAGALDMPKVVEAPFQQTDLLPSLAWLLGERACRDPFAGSFLRPDPQPATALFHVRGDDRNRVDVYLGDEAVYGFHLDGDASDWIDEVPPDAGSIAAWITVQRSDAAARRAAKQRVPDT